mmetsp:Transcript_7697/g.21757  ORF Transcript_7697/g.21757 Transcript_7697/m.21757 type:complete len:285 (-) Transcript_7697:70-924(-)
MLQGLYICILAPLVGVVWLRHHVFVPVLILVLLISHEHHVFRSAHGDGWIVSRLVPAHVEGAATEVPLHHAQVPVVVVRGPRLHAVARGVVPEDAPHGLRLAAANLGPLLGLVPANHEGAVLVQLAHDAGIPLPSLRVESVHHVTNLVVRVDDDLLHIPGGAGRGLRAAFAVAVPEDLEGAVLVALSYNSRVPAPIAREHRLHFVTDLVVNEHLHLPNALRSTERDVRPAVRVVPADPETATFSRPLHRAVVPGPILGEDGADEVAGLDVGDDDQLPDCPRPAL